MKRILYVRNQNQSFDQIDLKLLQEKWTVRDRYEKSIKKINLFAILRDVLWSDMVFCWFASWHSLLPVLFARLLRKPALVVIGGYDTANLPESKYGSQRGGIRKWLARTVIHNATHLIVNSESARRESIENAGADPSKISLIYHGLEPVSGPNILVSREQIALNVGGVWEENLLRKGLLPFVQAAKFLPDVRFVHVGKWYDQSIDILKSEAANNVEFKGFVSKEELETLFCQAAVYVQPSMHEGFGMSVAEAMTAGCIPVVTRVGSLPEVVGDAGIYSDSNAPQDIASAIKQALSANHQLRLKARERVVNEFAMARRQQALHQLITHIMV